ncbi:MAG: hypothetical protein H7836_04810 [Magnetococcus sp. YQC-3]
MAGVVPKTIPDDAFSTDISTNDVAQLSVTFGFDGGFFTKESKGVVDRAILLMKQMSKNADGSSNSYTGTMASMSHGVGSASSATAYNGELTGNRTL